MLNTKIFITLDENALTHYIHLLYVDIFHIYWILIPLIPNNSYFVRVQSNIPELSKYFSAKHGFTKKKNCSRAHKATGIKMSHVNFGEK